MEELKRQLYALYDVQADPEGKSAASRWLSQFRTSPEAWTLLDQLLGDTSSRLEFTFYAAHSIHLKICNDLQDLPSEAVDSLRQSLFQYLQTYQNQMPVARKLCSAIASLAVQMSSWLDPVSDILQVLPVESADTSVMFIQLLLFTELPFELRNRRIYVMDSRRRNFQAYLDSKSAFILQYLCQCMQAANGQPQLQEQVFECLSSWLYNIDGIPCEALINNPLVVAAFDALVAPELFDRAVDCICDLIRLSGRTRAYAELSTIIVPRALQIKDQFIQGAVDAEDEDTVRGYGRIFAEMGENYADFMLGGSDQAMSLLTVLVQLTGHPLHEIFLLVWRFFQDFAALIDAGNEETRAQRRAQFANHFWQVAEHARRHMVLPSDYEDWTTETKEDYRLARKTEMPDVLRAAASVVGPDQLLARLVAQAQEALPAARQALEADVASGRVPGPGALAQSGRQQTLLPTEVFMSPPIAELEGTLHAIRVLARAIDMLCSEVVGSVLQLIGQLPAHPRVQYTALLIVGRYAEWMRDHNPGLLTPQFTFITSCLSDVTLQSAAALAFRHVCEQCAGLVVTQFESLLQLHDAIPHDTMTVDDASEVVAGVAAVLLHCDGPQLEPYFGRLCAPYVSLLQSACDQVRGSAAAGGGGALPARASVVRPLDLLAELIATARPDIRVDQENPCARVFAALVPVLVNVLELFRADSDIVDAVCACLRRALRSYPLHLDAIIVSSMLGPVAQQFVLATASDAGVGAPQYLRVLTRAAERLAPRSDAGVTAPVLSAAETVLMATAQLVDAAALGSRQHAEAMQAAAAAGLEPPSPPWQTLLFDQCVHAYYELATALCYHFDDWACQSGLVSALVGQTMQLMLADTPGTARAAYMFFDHLLQLANERAAVQQAVGQTISERATELFVTLIRGLAGGLPVGMRTEVARLMASVRGLIGREQLAQAAGPALQQPFLANLADEHKSALSQAILHEDRLADAVHKFASACLQRKRWLL